MLNYKIYDNQKDFWVVFLHGIGGSTKTWLRQIKSFSDKYNLLMIDLPGHGESQDIGDKVDINDVLKNLQERDYIDSHREASPLTQAPDAIVLDNSHMDMNQQMEWLKGIITERFGE